MPDSLTPEEVADDEEICGESYDHLIPHWEDDDGFRVGVCSNCGAEIIEEDDDA